MDTKYYHIEPDLSDEKVAYIDDWEFTHWQNKPESNITQNEDGTFSVSLEKEFVPLVRQLQDLFKADNAPSEGTYLGEAVLMGAKKPLDLIEGDFINSNRGLFMSKKLLKIFRAHKLPNNSFYEVSLIKGRKKFSDYGYLYFSDSGENDRFDLRLLKVNKATRICVSEELKNSILSASIEGCNFNLMKEST